MIKRRVSQKPREVCQGTDSLKNIFIWMPSGTSKHYKTHLSSDICSSSVFQVCQPGPVSSHYPLSHQSLYTPLLLKPSIYSSFADLLTPLLWFLSTIPFSFFPSLNFFVLLQQPSWSFPSLVSVPHLSNWPTQYWQSNYTEAHSVQKIFIGSPLTILL